MCIKRFIRFVCLAFMIGIGASGVSFAQTSPRPPVNVVATTGMIADAARAIGTNEVSPQIQLGDRAALLQGRRDTARAIGTNGVVRQNQLGQRAVLL